MKTKILVVDDDTSVRESIARALAYEGYQPVTAANGDEALGIAASTRIDLVLLDLNMPVKNGWDTFKQLTAANPGLPVIIVTARPNQLFTALASGTTALVEKPLDFFQLLETIKKALAGMPPAAEPISRSV